MKHIALIALILITFQQSLKAGVSIADSLDTVIDSRSFNLNIWPAPTNGTIQGAGTYLSGSTISVIAIPKSGYRLANWTGSLSGSANPLTLVMDSNKQIGAIFEPDMTSVKTSIQFPIPTVVDLKIIGTTGVRYRIQESTNLKSWGTLESGTVGLSGVVNRLFPYTEGSNRFFRVEFY